MFRDWKCVREKLLERTWSNLACWVCASQHPACAIQPHQGLSQRTWRQRRSPWRQIELRMSAKTSTEDVRIGDSRWMSMGKWGWCDERTGRTCPGRSSASGDWEMKFPTPQFELPSRTAIQYYWIDNTVPSVSSVLHIVQENIFN